MLVFKTKHFKRNITFYQASRCCRLDDSTIKIIVVITIIIIIIINSSLEFDCIAGYPRSTQPSILPG